MQRRVFSYDENGYAFVLEKDNKIVEKQYVTYVEATTTKQQLLDSIDWGSWAEVKYLYAQSLNEDPEVKS